MAWEQSPFHAIIWSPDFRIARMLRVGQYTTKCAIIRMSGSQKQKKVYRRWWDMHSEVAQKWSHKLLLQLNCKEIGTCSRLLASGEISQYLYPGESPSGLEGMWKDTGSLNEIRLITKAKTERTRSWFLLASVVFRNLLTIEMKDERSLSIQTLVEVGWDSLYTFAGSCVSCKVSRSEEL